MRRGTGWLLAAVLSVAGACPASAQDHPEPAPERPEAPKEQSAQPRRRPPVRRSVVIVLQDSNAAPTDAPRHAAHLPSLPHHLPPWVRALLEQHGPPGDPAWVDGETCVEITSPNGLPSDDEREADDLDFDVELLWSEDDDDDNERPHPIGGRPWIFTVQTPGRVVQSTRLEDLNRALRHLQLPPMTETEIEELVTLAPDEDALVVEVPEGCAEECTPPTPELPERMRTLHHFLQQMHDRLERIERRATSSEDDDDDDDDDDEDPEEVEDGESAPDAPAKERQGPY